MTRRADKERLLNDALGGDDAAFREALFGETLRVAKRRRNLREMRGATVAAAIIFVIALVFWRSAPTHQPTRVAEKKAYEVVISQPLAAREVVTTRPLAASEIVVSSPSVHVFQTADSHAAPHEIDDGQLLALLGPTPVALV